MSENKPIYGKEKIDDGGPAFPIAIFPHTLEMGITKREWFAAMASDRDVTSAAQAFMYTKKCDTCSVAEARYYHADLMIAESNREQGESNGK